MTIDIRRTQRGGLLASEAPIDKRELAMLRKAKEAHDHYLRAVTILSNGSEPMRIEAAGGSEYARGYLACLHALHTTIISGDDT